MSQYFELELRHWKELRQTEQLHEP